MLFSGRTQMMSGRYSVFEALDHFGKIGFNGVELCYEDINFHLKPDLWDPGVIALIRDCCDSLGLAISAVGNHLRYFYDDFMFEAIKKCIKTTRLYGTDVFIFAAMNDAVEADDYKALRSVAIKRIGELCELAESEGVKLALEPEPPSIVTSTGDFLDICAEIGSPALGVNFDVGHALLTDDDVVKSVELLRGRIWHGHIEDMKRGTHKHLMPGEGDIDFRALFGKLRETGFDGFMSIDMYHEKYEEIAGPALAALRSFT